MKEITIAQAPVFTSPNPMTFICSKKADGKTNMATLAFWTYASTNLGKVVFSLNKGAYTLELLAKNKEVVIAVPGVSLTGALIACGTSSGRATDKVEKFGIAMQKLAGTETGNCKGKIPTKKEWADNLCMQAKARGVPVFMKEALEGIMPADKMIQEFPKEFGI